MSIMVFALITFISGCSQQFTNKQTNTRLVQISESKNEQRYTFVGENVFQIIILKNINRVDFNTVDHLSTKDFHQSRTLISWQVDYNSAKEIAQNASKSFDGKLNELGYLEDKPIRKYCGGGIIPTNNPIVPHVNPYWTFSAFNDQKTYTVHIDAFDGRIIYTCEGYLK